MRPERWLPRIKWTFVVAFRHAFGRWFIFRDAPSWFVVEMAASDIEGLSEEAMAEAELRVGRSTRLVRDVREHLEKISRELKE